MKILGVNAYASRKRGDIEKYELAAIVPLFISPVYTFLSPARQ